ncbi:MAG TPA: hypothetical protein DCK93_17885 [Blastocatellia bacterium]|nr:hypothetical protein [Blastocatellia bacterium]HAF24745.1 hypothetical protein [Blastocatellia bacterium]
MQRKSRGIAPRELRSHFRKVIDLPQIRRQSRARQSAKQTGLELSSVLVKVRETDDVKIAQRFIAGIREENKR